MSNGTSRKLTDACEELRAKWPRLLAEYEDTKPGYTLTITCTHRTPEEQWELFKKGRRVDVISHKEIEVLDHDAIVTYCDGIHKLSKHNFYPSKAIDVAVMDKKAEKLTWQEYHYHPLVHICSTLGLTSGGSFSHLRDWPHIEVGI